MNWCPLVVLLCTLALSAAGAADERDERLRALEKRIEQLELLLQSQGLKLLPLTNTAPATNTEASVSAPKSLPSLSVGGSGFALRSADSNFVLRLRGLLQVDSVWSDDNNITDTFLLRRARPIMEGTVFRDFDFRFTPEFAGSSPTIRDAWLNYRYNDALELRVGKMKSPGNLERWQSVANTLFIERALPSLLWPVREVGVMVHGDLWSGNADASDKLAAGGLVHYDLGGFNGTGDGRAAANSDFDDSKSFEGRMFFHPFLKSALPVLHKFGVGVAGTYGEMHGDLGLPDDYSYAGDVTAAGEQWRLGPQAYGNWGPFGLMAEYAISSQRLAQETAPFNTTRAENRAWQITASWMLTGEDATFRGLTPKNNFDPRNGRWGAWQLVARYASLDIDNGLFPDFADPTELPTEVRNWGFGLNWYLNRNIRLELNYNHFDSEEGEGGIDDVGEHVISTRVQLAF